MKVSRRALASKKVWYPPKMPRRFKALAALLLALVVCLVLVMPQVDLDSGVLKDVQYQTFLFMMAFAEAFIWLLPPEFFNRFQEQAFKHDVSLCSGAWSSSILRC
ncbi:MAG TPA: hypothetical protein VFU50_01475 [Terriglobales bacterium]|nr:hypothetical protein [Terriglobales bacterium]